MRNSVCPMNFVCFGLEQFRAHHVSSHPFICILSIFLGSTGCFALSVNVSIHKHPWISVARWDIREKYFTASSLADLFNRADNHTVIENNFIKETHFYHQL